MTLVTQGKPSRKRSVWGHNTSTTTEDVYTCPANCVGEVVYIIVNNSGSSTNSVSVKWYDSSANSGSGYASGFVEGKSLNAGDYIEFQGIELVLDPGDKIQITPTSSGHIDSIITVVETFVPVG
jgi:hypothetical protein